MFIVVSYGAGTNSTALLAGMYEKGIYVDLILFANTGAEMPHTYEYIDIMNTWLIKHGMPEITIVENVDHNGDRLTLEEECLRSHSLPSLAYGFKIPWKQMENSKLDHIPFPKTS